MDAKDFRKQLIEVIQFLIIGLILVLGGMVIGFVFVKGMDILIGFR